MYNILIKDKDSYKFVMIKTEIMVDTTQISTGETVQVGSGRYKWVKYETNSITELEEKCIELTATMGYENVLPIIQIDFDVDLIWGDEDEDSDPVDPTPVCNCNPTDNNATPEQVESLF